MTTADLAAAGRDPAGSPAGEEVAVRLVNTAKRYGDVTAVECVSLTVRRRELFTLLGPSGSGKTTILRMIAGLVRPSAGEIWLGAEQVHERPPYERNVGVVFQSLALFPHMDVFSNIAFPLRMRRTGRSEVADRVRRALDMVRLPDIASRGVAELSGGQQQRVALARALVYEPELLLLDEPLGALDRRLREEMQLEILRLHHEIDVTIINVTHDQREALILSDRIGVMRLGRLEQVGPSEALYRVPRTRFVAEFLGDANLLAGRGSIKGDSLMVITPTGARVLVENLPTGVPSGEFVVVVRAESVDVASPEDSRGSPSSNRFSGRVVVKAFEGPSIYYEVAIEEVDATFKVLTNASRLSREYAVGDEVVVGWEPGAATVLGGEDAAREPSDADVDATS